ncbi:Carboxypeptidase A4 [Hondaea fermentalgiana]|uniref:Carboxypeptidase A4 n=1 Tax=Hondaea fermentalgiana TaxID=2315210 RepID=A0A2R5GFR1_9STRA|nr:Carboxypeptidase A4 [Hondaea fermentalgiana]|eukprot:GBG28578.1 Carboxypeptidase A4 [Hondaea fermentalgiana]
MAGAGTAGALEARACNVYLRYDSTAELLWRIASDLNGLHGVSVRAQELARTSEDRPLITVTMESMQRAERSLEDPLEVLMIGGMHAREWISSASVLCLMVRHFERLAEILATSPVRLAFLANLNPDGYAYTRTTQRSWRRTRTPLPRGGKFAGIDLNRNFGVANETWGFGNPEAFFSELYQGEYPFEALEARALRDLVLAGNPARRIVLDVHCCAKVVFPVYNASEVRVAEATQLAHASQGVLRYRERSDVIDAKNTGIAVDWMERYAGVRAAFMLEVPGKAQPVNFHDLFRVPASAIAGTTDMIELILEEAVKLYAQDLSGANSVESEQPRLPEVDNSDDGIEIDNDDGDANVLQAVDMRETKSESFVIADAGPLSGVRESGFLPTLAEDVPTPDESAAFEDAIIFDAFTKVEDNQDMESVHLLAAIFVLGIATLALCVEVIRRCRERWHAWRMEEARRKL